MSFQPIADDPFIHFTCEFGHMVQFPHFWQHKFWQMQQPETFEPFWMDSWAIFMFQSWFWKNMRNQHLVMHNSSSPKVQMRIFQNSQILSHLVWNCMMKAKQVFPCLVWDQISCAKPWHLPKWSRKMHTSKQRVNWEKKDKKIESLDQSFHLVKLKIWFVSLHS